MVLTSVPNIPRGGARSSTHSVITGTTTYGGITMGHINLVSNMMNRSRF